MNSSESIFHRVMAVAAILAAVLLSGPGGAPSASALATGPLVAENHEDENSEDESSEDDNSDEDEDNSDEDEDNSEDEDSSDEDEDSSDEDEPTDDPTEQPTFTDPPTTDPTDVTEMPTQDVDETSEAGASPLGWILLGGGVACAAAAVAVYRRNRHIM